MRQVEESAREKDNRIEVFERKMVQYENQVMVASVTGCLCALLHLCFCVFLCIDVFASVYGFICYQTKMLHFLKVNLKAPGIAAGV